MLNKPLAQHKYIVCKVPCSQAQVQFNFEVTFRNRIKKQHL